MIETNSAALASFPSKVTGDEVSASEINTLVGALKEVNASDAADLPDLSAAYQPKDATLTALAALDSAAGVLEQTGADAFTKRAFGVGASTSVPTRADADARYAAAAHTHAVADVTGLQAALDAKADDSDLSAYQTTAGFTAAAVVAKFAGTPNGAKFLRDDGTLAAPSAGASFPLLAPDGSAAAPSYSFAGAPGDGVYSVVPGAVGIASAGVFRMLIGSGGITLQNGAGNWFAAGYLQPSFDGTQDIGDPTHRVRDTHVGRFRVFAQSSANPTAAEVPAGSVAEYVKSGKRCRCWNDAGTLRFSTLTLGTDVQYSAWSTTPP